MHFDTIFFWPVYNQLQKIDGIIFGMSLQHFCWHSNKTFAFEFCSQSTQMDRIWFEYSKKRKSQNETEMLGC